jgi:hypothetical protein
LRSGRRGRCIGYGGLARASLARPVVRRIALPRRTRGLRSGGLGPGGSWRVALALLGGHLADDDLPSATCRRMSSSLSWRCRSRRSWSVIDSAPEPRARAGEGRRPLPAGTVGRLRPRARRRRRCGTAARAMAHSSRAVSTPRTKPTPRSTPSGAAARAAATPGLRGGTVTPTSPTCGQPRSPTPPHRGRRRRRHPALVLRRRTPRRRPPGRSPRPPRRRAAPPERLADPRRRALARDHRHAQRKHVAATVPSNGRAGLRPAARRARRGNGARLASGLRSSTRSRAQPTTRPEPTVLAISRTHGARPEALTERPPRPCLPSRDPR